ncbi:protein of unknown function [Rhodovastum atsumiense]|nr:protein of unknown function [Rhodovastum atsumiense]
MFSEAVTMTSISPAWAISTALRTQRQPASPASGESRPGRMASRLGASTSTRRTLPAGAGPSAGTKTISAPTSRLARSMKTRSPITSVAARSSSGIAAMALQITSGPIPAGSPMVMPILLLARMRLPSCGVRAPARAEADQSV